MFTRISWLGLIQLFFPFVFVVLFFFSFLFVFVFVFVFFFFWPGNNTHAAKTYTRQVQVHEVCNMEENRKSQNSVDFQIIFFFWKGKKKKKKKKKKRKKKKKKKKKNKQKTNLRESFMDTQFLTLPWYVMCQHYNDRLPWYEQLWKSNVSPVQLDDESSCLKWYCSAILRLKIFIYKWKPRY